MSKARGPCCSTISSLAKRVEDSHKNRSRASKRKHCEHCDQDLSLKTYKKHKSLYLRADGTWITEDSTTSSHNQSECSSSAPSLPIFISSEDAQVSPTCEVDIVANDMDPDNPLGSDESSDDSDVSEQDVDSAEDNNSVTLSDCDEVWEESSDDDEICASVSGPTMPSFASLHDQKGKALSLWMVGFLVQLHSKHYIPDAALDALIKFLFVFLTVLVQIAPSVSVVRECFPRSLYHLHKSDFFQFDKSFIKYVVCPNPNCNYLCEFEDAVSKSGAKTMSNKCPYVRFPKHKLPSQRKPCGTLLLKNITTVVGREFLYPFSTYCYKPFIPSLQSFLLRPSSFSDCQSWRSRTSDCLSDIYDGRIWKEFQTPFFVSMFAFGLMLNIDWFQPYSHTTYSVGVIYLSILNLPRSLRFKRQNVILLGIIPGPSEPKHDINVYLEPLVKELLMLWKGVKLQVQTPQGIVNETVRCALLCIACDLPACRKVCGFLSHSAKLGCSKCLKEFKGEPGSMDYSGFNRSSWPLRTGSDHRKSIRYIRKRTTKAALTKAESSKGCRYSVLGNLPYLDLPRHHIIDPMHNLFLGTGKHLISMWIHNNYLSKASYGTIQAFVDQVVLPSDVGRIPFKILSGFSGFKADQFKLWITVYSIPALFDALPSDLLECWRHFVLACRLLCKHALTQTDVSVADALLMRFCGRAQQLYGASYITPNMHLHAHLKEVILDYGPIQEFWLFPYERYNGILGNQPSNNRH